MPEITAKRTYTSKTIDNGNGTFTLLAHVGHIHYKDDQGAFNDVDYTLEDKGTYWRMEKANYRLYIAKDFGASQLIRFENRYEGANHAIYFEPHSLWWVDRTNPSNRTLFRNAQPVQGTVDTQENKIVWAGAFGADIDFELRVRRSGFTKEIVVKNKAALGNPPSANHDLVVLCKYTGAGLKVRANDAVADWNNSTRYESSEGFAIKEGVEALRSFIRPSYAIDSGKPRRQTRLKVFWELRNAMLWQAKVLPLAALQAATYPVRADTTTSYYSGAGDGEVGCGDLGPPVNWDQAHDAVTGDYANYTNTFAEAPCSALGSEYWIGRVFCPIDTSGLPDDAVISSAILYLWFYTKSNADNDGDDWINVVQTSQASPTALVKADYDQCGAVNNPTEGATRIDITNITTGQYTPFTLNATGLTWIKKTAADPYTMLGLREGHDCIDSAITGTPWCENAAYWRTSEYTGTANDPYLEVVYTAPQTLTPGGIAGAEGFGTSKLNLNINPSAVNSTEAFGGAKLNLRLLASSITSLEAFGAGKLNFLLLPGAISSAEAFGTLKANLRLAPSGISTSELFGADKLIYQQFLTPSAIASLEAFGGAIISLGARFLYPSGIASLETFGSGKLNIRVFPSSIMSGEGFGAPLFTIKILPSGIIAAEGFGTQKINLRILASPVPSSEVFGSPQMIIRQFLLPSGVMSAELFGLLVVSGGEIYPIIFQVDPRDRTFDVAPRTRFFPVDPRDRILDGRGDKP